jgi:hypothetical protein
MNLLFCLLLLIDIRTLLNGHLSLLQNHYSGEFFGVHDKTAKLIENGRASSKQLHNVVVSVWVLTS